MRTLIVGGHRVRLSARPFEGGRDIRPIAAALHLWIICLVAAAVTTALLRGAPLDRGGVAVLAVNVLAYGVGALARAVWRPRPERGAPDADDGRWSSAPARRPARDGR